MKIALRFLVFFCLTFLQACQQEMWEDTPESAVEQTGPESMSRNELSFCDESKFVWDSELWNRLKTDSLFLALIVHVERWQDKTAYHIMDESNNGNIHVADRIFAPEEEEEAQVYFDALILDQLMMSIELNDKLRQRYPEYSGEYADSMLNLQNVFGQNDRNAQTRGDVIGSCKLSRDVLVESGSNLYAIDKGIELLLFSCYGSTHDVRYAVLDNQLTKMSLSRFHLFFYHIQHDPWIYQYLFYVGVSPGNWGCDNGLWISQRIYFTYGILNGDLKLQMSRALGSFYADPHKFIASSLREFILRPPGGGGNPGGNVDPGEKPGNGDEGGETPDPNICGDCNRKPCICVPGEPEIILTKEKSICTAGQFYTIKIDISGFKIPEVKSVEVQMERTSAQNYWTKVYSTTRSSTSITYDRRAATPGEWKIRAKVDFQGGGPTHFSNIEIVEERYPNVEEILAKPSLIREFEMYWDMVKWYATEHQKNHEVIEVAAFIHLDTKTNSYRLDDFSTPVPFRLLAGNETVSIPSESPSPTRHNPDETPILVVGHFHTHFPIRYAATPCERDGGPTAPNDYDAVNHWNMPGFVYDYDGEITSDDPIDSKAKIFTYGDNSYRPTPR